MQVGEHVDGHVGEVAAPVLHHQVEVDVVGLAEAARGQRAGDADAEDVRAERNQPAHEPIGLGQVCGGGFGVPRRAAADAGCAGNQPRAHDQPRFLAQLARGSCDREPDLEQRDRAADAELAQAGRRQGISAVFEQYHGPAHPLQQP